MYYSIGYRSPVWSVVLSAYIRSLITSGKKIGTEGFATVKIQCQVSSGERTALAANSINCNPWNKKEKRKKETSEFMIST